jgi:hypothetical protein
MYRTATRFGLSYRPSSENVLHKTQAGYVYRKILFAKLKIFIKNVFFSNILAIKITVKNVRNNAVKV